MHTPREFLAYTPRGAGLRCALVYLATPRDVYGWFTGPRDDGAFASAYFLLEEFYSTHEARLVTVKDSDLYTNWIGDEARRHELARLQDVFSREWLFYRSDERAARELEAYALAELAAGEVNVRYERLERFSKLQPTWVHFSREFERPVLNFVAKRWPLEYRGE